MKVGTQSVNAFGESTFTSGPPTVLPTNPNSPFAKLIVKSELGQIVQQWLVLQNKCTLGSAPSCALHCQLPGIAPYHALLVMGARQVFIRALAPKLSRNGVVVNELLLTEEQGSFEVAGHQFELIRATRPIEPSSKSRSPLNKMKFSLARSMDTSPNRTPSPQPNPTVATLQTPEPSLPFTQSPRSLLTAQASSNPANYNAATTNSVLNSSPTNAAQARWISDLIQSAMQPLERQLHDVLEPLAAVQRELDKRASRKREQRKAAPKAVGASPENSQFTTQIDIQPQIAHVPEPIMVPIISPIVEEQLAKQTNSLAALAECLVDLKNNLGALERTVAESKANIPQPINPEPVVIPVMSPLVESQLVQQSESLQSVNDRLNGVTNHLGALERIVTDNFVTVIGATSVPTPEPIVLPDPIDMEPVNEALRKITSVAEQIQGLTGQLDEVKSNLGSLEQILNENLSSTNRLASAPPQASSETHQQLSKVAGQLSQLLQEMNQRQASVDESVEPWREILSSQIDQLQPAASATESSIHKVNKQLVNTLLGTCPTSAALILNGNLRTLPVALAGQPLTNVAAIPAPMALAIPLPTAISQAATAYSTTGFDSQAELQSQEGFDSQARQAQTPVPLVPASGSKPAPALMNSIAASGLPADVEPVNFIAPVAAVEAVESDEAIESVASVFSAWASTTEPVLDSEPSIQDSALVTPAPSTWSVSEGSSRSEIEAATESNHADFIEETIEEGSVGSPVVSNELPSWWTDDDKTIYQDNTSANSSADTTWNLSSAPVQQDSFEPESQNSSVSGLAAPAPDLANSDDVSARFAQRNFAQHNADLNVVEQAAAISNPARPAISGFEADASWAIESDSDSSPTALGSTSASSTSASSTLASGAAPSAMIAGIPFDELANEEPASNDSDSQAISSLLERFGIAREPKSEPSGLVGLPSASFDASALDNSVVSDLAAEEAAWSPEPALAPVPPAAPVPAPVTEAARKELTEEVVEEVGEESVEDYMKRLMARMRGGSLGEESKPAGAAAASPAVPTTVFNAAGASKSQSDSVSASGKVPLPSAVTERNNSTTSRFNPEEYVPKALSPEKTRNMAAMRELANTSARSAIQVSARRRYGTAIALKLAIALTGLGVGTTLVMINGLKVNIALIATIASFLVAMIWGFDAVSTIRPLLYSASETPPPEMPVEIQTKEA